MCAYSDHLRTFGAVGDPRERFTFSLDDEGPPLGSRPDALALGHALGRVLGTPRRGGVRVGQAAGLAQAHR
jgi:hypothetical protein